MAILDGSWPRAVHEASHACACVLLGATTGAGPVTIVGGADYTGACHFGSLPAFEPADLDALGAPYPLLPHKLRAFYETRAMVLLAGDIGEVLHVVRDGTPGRWLRPLAPAQARGGTQPMPANEQATLDAVAALDEHLSDMAKVLEMLHGLHGADDVLAHKHAAFLAAETESLLSGPRAGRMITSLAEALCRSRSLPSAAWIGILAAAR